MVHGDLTTSNFMIDSKRGLMFVIDFGLAQVSLLEEDFAVDLYVLERAMVSTHPNSENLFLEVLRHYSAHWSGGTAVVKRLNEVRQRGRKKIAFG
jgi:TP53 regulating kinase-like protein